MIRGAGTTHGGFTSTALPVMTFVLVAPSRMSVGVNVEVAPHGAKAGRFPPVVPWPVHEYVQPAGAAGIGTVKACTACLAAFRDSAPYVTAPDGTMTELPGLGFTVTLLLAVTGPLLSPARVVAVPRQVKVDVPAFDTVTLSGDGCLPPAPPTSSTVTVESL